MDIFELGKLMEINDNGSRTVLLNLDTALYTAFASTLQLVCFL